LRVCAKPLIRVAVLAKEGGDCFWGVADGNRINLHAFAAEFGEHWRFTDAWHTPARENVEQPRFASCEIGRFQASLAWDGGSQIERRDLAFDQLRGDRRISRLDEPPGEARYEPNKQNDRDQAQAAAHA
jgi:hypothetical protein